MNSNFAMEVLNDIFLFENRSLFEWSGLYNPDHEYMLDTRMDEDGVTCLMVRPTVLCDYDFDEKTTDFSFGVGVDNPQDGYEELQIMGLFFKNEAKLSSVSVRAYGKTLEKKGCCAVDTMIACQAVEHALLEVAKQIERFLAEEKDN